MGNLDSFRSFEENISLYFDHALSAKDEQQLFERLDNDPSCCQKFEKEKSARQFLKNKFQRSTVSNDMIESIKKRLQTL